MAQKEWWKRGIGWACGEIAGSAGLFVGIAEGLVAATKGESFSETVYNRTTEWEEAGKKFGEDNSEELGALAVGLASIALNSAVQQSVKHNTEDFWRHRHGEDKKPLPPVATDRSNRKGLES